MTALRKVFLSAVCRNSLLLLLTLLCITSHLQAQIDVPIGTGTLTNADAGYPCPMQDWYEGSRSQFLYRASELVTAGMGPGNINAISFTVTGRDPNTGYTHPEVEQYTIKIATTATASLNSNTWEPGTTIVYGPVDYMPVTGVNTFAFNVPFFWNGTDNIVIEVCNGANNNNSGGFYSYNPRVTWTTALGFNGSHSYRIDDNGNLCGTADTQENGEPTTRPNAIFNWTAAPPCTGTPVAGTAIATPGSVCLGQAFQAKLQGATVASGLTYQWQLSKDNIFWTDITGAKAFGYSATQDTTTYYRAKVTCTAGGGFAYSTPVQVLSPSLIQGVFTINKNAPAGSGNLQSFNDAYNLIKCGISDNVTFNVVAGSGPYDEQLVMQPVPGASATKKVTFNGNGQILQYTATNSAERAVIKLDGADHIIFDSLMIHANGTGSGAYGYGVQIMNNADSNTINRCTIVVDSSSEEESYAGIVINNSATDLTAEISALCDGNTITNNTITGGYCGMVLASSTTASNSRTIFQHNTVREFYKYGMYIRGSFLTAVQFNTFSRPSRYGGSSDIYGLYADGLSTRLSVNANTFTHLLGGITSNSTSVYGIALNQVKALAGLDNLVSNNLIYTLGDKGKIYGISNTGSSNVAYYNNTISIDGNNPATSSGPDIVGYYQEPQSANITFKNNIITISRTGAGEKTAMYFTSSANGLASDRNNLYIFPGIGGVTHIGHIDNIDMATLLDWQTGSGMDAASFSQNPFYADLSAGNLRPINASIDNKGVPIVQVPADINSVTRSTTTPDLGVYEFTPPPCVTPPIPGHVKLSKDTVCANSLVMLGLEGYTNGVGQTYQWQSATTAAGPFTNLGGVLTSPDTSVRSASNIYFRVQVTCSSLNSYSDTTVLTIRYPLAGGTYVIDKNAASGSPDYKSFNQAKTAMACGIDDAVVFNVKPGSGVYDEQLVLDAISGTSATATVTFNGNGNSIHFSPDDAGERGVIKLNNADHIIFDSLTIDASGNGGYGYGVQLINDADSNTIRKCIITIPFNSSDTYYGGIVINANPEALSDAGDAKCDGNTFDKNKISGGYYGIAITGIYDNHIFNNRITNNQIQDFYAAGIYRGYCSGTIIDHNTISRPTRGDVSDFSGIVCWANSDNELINANRIFNPFGGDPGNTGSAAGISFWYGGAEAGKEVLVANNLIYDFNGKGEMSGINNFGSDYIHYYHNTISLDNVSNTSTYNTTGFNMSYSLIEWRNNIITITRGGSGDKQAMNISGESSDWIIDHNDYYVNGAQPDNYIGYYNSYHATMADWQAATGQDAHSLNIDPVYSGPAVGNFMPAISPMENTGDSAGVKTDIAGVSRSATTPDIGAYEFTLPPCTAPPVAGTAIVIPNSGVCMGTIVDLTLNGNSTGGGQTYQWQKSANGTSGWTDIGPRQYVKESKTEVMHSDYFRCGVACGTDTVFSASAQIQLNAAFPGGVYTIDNSGNGDFPSFTAAVAAMECGITGAVTFNVKPGIFNEKVRMHRIVGASDTSRVTFQSANGVSASVLLTNDATDDADNYVLKLDSASYITYRGITIQATNDTYGHAVHLLNTSSYDSLLNCIIISHATTSTADELAAVMVDNFSGKNDVIKGNTVQNGATGIRLAGTFDDRLPALLIDSNKVSGFYEYGIYAYNADYLKVTRNTIDLGASQNSPAHGIYLTDCDSTFLVTGNTVNINNTTESVYGITINDCSPNIQRPSAIEGNKILAVTNNTGSVVGFNTEDNKNMIVRNNVISIHATGDNAYGIYSSNSGLRYENNSVHSTATTTTDNYAAYFWAWSSGNGTSILANNIFSNTGGGKAIYTGFKELYSGDYNMLYTTGTGLADVDVDTYNTLQDWIDATDQDFNSIVYKPAFVSDTDLHPKVSDSTVWGMHGRGVQITGNDHDINNDPRPVTLQAGVPDLGAYEFVPTSVPPVSVAIPAVPAANSRQAFMLGTDTVYTITWGATVPQQLKVRRYSGVVPPALAPGAKYMYFYTDAEVTGTGATGYTLQQHYLDPWRGFIDPENRIRLGRTKAAGAWVVDTASRTDVVANVIGQRNLDYLGKFTGLTDSTVANPEDNYMSADSSNRGTRFWVGYGNHQFFSGDNSQEMLIYLSAQDSANVTVRINGTSWVKQYHIPANTVITSDLIPKSGMSDARLLLEGKSDRGISIESDVPIVVYTHIYGITASGATMLLPVGTYGYEYYSINSQQNYGDDCYSWFYVVANHDSTVVELTPANPTLAGRPANVPFTVMLNKGEIYQVLGAIQPQGFGIGYDLTGSRVRAIPNDGGKCYPIAVFSGSGRTSISCDNSGGSGDNIMQQNFPSQAWGKRYLTAPTSVSSDPTSTNNNIFRVAVKDPATIVKLNGTPLTGLINNYYYEYVSDIADYIEADQPVMVAQYMPSEGACNGSGEGDPEMFYLSPIEQGIKAVSFYRNSQLFIETNYLTLIIPTNGVNSLLIDGANDFDFTYPHPNLAGYTVVVKRWDAAQAQVAVSSDSAFTAITYGQGSAESYGYNAGTLVRNLNSLPGFTNVFDSSGHNSDHTCVGTPFRFNMQIPVKPLSITWKFSEVSNLTPHTDSIQINPVPLDSTVVNGRKLYHYSINQDFVFGKTGTYYIPITYKHPDIESCDNTTEVVLSVNVIGKPQADFTVAYSGCLNDIAQFNGSAITSNNTPVGKWKWDFDDNTGSGAKDTTKKFSAPGTYNVRLSIVGNDGCIADTIKQVTASAYAALNFVNDSIVVCLGTPAVLAIQNPEAGITYSWYDAPAGGTLQFSGTTHTITTVTATVNYYVTAVKNGCASPREKITATILPKLEVPVVTVDTVGTNLVRYAWTAVAGAVGYQVSIDGGTTWITPSSGATGLTHTVTGLRPVQEVMLKVKVKGESECQDTTSANVKATTLPDQVFIPNAFSPNGDGLNDVVRVYGYIIKEMRFSVFNQWGEKVFETRDQIKGWDGTYKGKPQPSGVYMYVCQLLLTDGTTQIKKGAINLVR